MRQSLPVCMHTWQHTPKGTQGNICIFRRLWNDLVSNDVFEDILYAIKMKPTALHYCIYFAIVIGSSSSIWRGSTWAFARAEPWVMPWMSTHHEVKRVPIFGRMVVTHLFVKKVSFFNKQELVWCCIYSILSTPNLCAFRKVCQVCIIAHLLTKKQGFNMQWLGAHPAPRAIHDPRRTFHLLLHADPIWAS